MDPDTFIERAEELFDLAPIREVWFAELEDYAEIARCKHLLRLRALDLTGSGLSQHFDPVPLIKSRYLANLTTLRLGGQDDNGHLDMKGIRGLIAARHLGNVEELDLSGNWLNQFDPATFATFLSARNLPSLRNLNLEGVGVMDGGAADLASTPWVGRLQGLDLRRNLIGERGARAILETPLLEKITLLDLRDNLRSEEESLPISRETRQALTERFGERVRL
jgi:hypothetical protein